MLLFLAEGVAAKPVGYDRIAYQGAVGRIAQIEVLAHVHEPPGGHTAPVIIYRQSGGIHRLSRPDMTEQQYDRCQ